MGFLVSQHGQLDAIPPPPFLSVSPLESMQSGGAIPPPRHKRGISAILARYHKKTRQMDAMPPSAILSRKGIARYGGLSRTGPLRAHFTVPKAYPCPFLSSIYFVDCLCQFYAGLPFPVPEILQFVAFGDSGKFFQQFSRNFPETFLQNSRKDPRNSRSLLEFSEFRRVKSTPDED